MPFGAAHKSKLFSPMFTLFIRFERTDHCVQWFKLYAEQPSIETYPLQWYDEVVIENLHIHPDRNESMNAPSPVNLNFMQSFKS